MTRGDFDLYKPTNTNDPVKLAEYKPTKQPFEYKPYKPSNVGIYGEKMRTKVPKPATPPKLQNSYMPLRKPKTTFESYSKPSGPDIRTDNSGPEYKVKEYDYKGPYKPHPKDPHKYVDPLPGNRHINYMDSKPVPYKGDVDYKLTEKNNLGMRHWGSTFVEDTISAKADTKEKVRNPQRKYIVPEKAKKENKPTAVKPATPKTPPAKKTKKQPPVPVVAPIPSKKTFKTSSTQHEAPRSKTIPTQTQTQNAKTLGTQYDRSTTKTFGTQSEPTTVTSTNMQTDTPLPDIVPAPVVAPVTMSQPKPATKSTGIQCEEPKKKTVGAGTQYKGPNTKVIETQTSPAPAQTPKRRASPVVERAEPVHAADNRTPSPARHNTPSYIRQAPTPPPSYWRNQPTSPKRTPPYIRSPPRRRSTPMLAPLVAAPIVSRRRTPTPEYRRTPTPPADRTPTPQDRWTPTTPSYRHEPSPPYNETPPPRQQTPPYRETHPSPQQLPPYQDTHPPPETPPYRATNPPPQQTPPSSERHPSPQTPPYRGIHAPTQTPPYRETHPPPQIPPYRGIHAPIQTPPHRETHPSPQQTRTPPQIKVQSPSSIPGTTRSEGDSHWTPEPTPRTKTDEPPPVPQRQPDTNVYNPTPGDRPAAPQKPGPIGITPQNWNKWPPHAPSNKLPPEVNACIEAYNSAHTTNVNAN